MSWEVAGFFYPKPFFKKVILKGWMFQAQKTLSKMKFHPRKGAYEGLRFIGPSFFTPCLKELKVKLATQEQGEQPQPYIGG